jgi:hypothetical protein
VDFTQTIWQPCLKSQTLTKQIGSFDIFVYLLTPSESRSTKLQYVAASQTIFLRHIRQLRTAAIKNSLPLRRGRSSPEAQTPTFPQPASPDKKSEAAL